MNEQEEQEKMHIISRFGSLKGFIDQHSGFLRSIVALDVGLSRAKLVGHI
jgi:hypothetical protein